MNEDLKEGVEKLKTAKRWWDQFAADHPRIMWAWALSVSAYALILWLANRVMC